MTKACRILLVVVVMLTLTSVNAGAAGYLKIGDIKGESSDEGHKEWIDVLSVDWGMSRVPGRSGSARGSGRLDFKDLTISKAVDSTSPSIMLKCAEGKRVPEVIFDLPLDSARGEAKMRMILKNAQVTSVHIGETETGDRPTEKISINYTELKVIYMGPFGVSEFGWDLRGGTAL